MDISLIKPNPNNPRIIKKDKFDKLVKSIKQFPEMLEARPLILNKDNIVLGGNMRLKALQKAGITDVPVIHVDWDADKESEFIIKDNLSYGEWDYDIIANEWDVIKLDDWGFDLPVDLENELDELEDGEDYIFPQSLQLEPPKEYILIMADANSEDWEEIKDRLKLKVVRRGGYKKGSPIDALSIERVFKWDDFKTRFSPVNTNESDIKC